MGIPILILGESGTGKSASMRNFKSDELALANVAGKPLPFKGRFDETINSDSYRTIKKFIKESFADVVVIDDAQYLMSNEFMRRANERGYDKFTEIGVNFWDLVRSVVEDQQNKIVVFLSHIERDVNGNEKIKTIGKLLDEKITVEGMFSIVLKTAVSDGKYSFVTQNSGHDTVKTPMGMFPTVEIDNDLKAVVDAVRKYYDMPGAPEEVPFESKEAEELAKEVEKEVGKDKEEKVEETPVKEAETKTRKRRTRKER